MYSTHPEMAKEWQEHTPKGVKLPEYAKKKKDNEKKAFVAAFLVKAAAAGITTPAQLAAAAEQYAGTAKAANDTLDMFGKGIGGLAGLPVMGAAAGLAATTAGGFGLGYLGGKARNQVDIDDADTLQQAALANAYRRRTEEAKTNAQVRKLVASDPSKYVVIG